MIFRLPCKLCNGVPAHPPRTGQAHFSRAHRRGKTGLYAQLPIYVLKMFLHRARTYGKARANLGISLSARDPEENVGLAAREAKRLECCSGGDHSTYIGPPA